MYAIIIGAGILAIILGFVCFSKQDLGSYVSNYQYGGDAFTGIQNAAAATGSNVKHLISVAAFGFGSVNIVLGMMMCAYGALKKAMLRQEATTEEVSVSNELPEI